MTRTLKQHSASTTATYVMISILLHGALINAQKIWPYRQGKRYQTRLAISCVPLVHTRIDPLVSFNETCSDHIHMVYGNKAFRSGMDFDDISKKTTTCNANNDFSSYWSPALYGRDKNGTLHQMPLMKNTVYYQTTVNSTQESGKELTRPFKKFFRMKGGNFHLDPANPVLGEQNFTYVSWQCPDIKTEMQPSYLDLKEYQGKCKTLMARIKFPDCIKNYKNDTDGFTPGKFAHSHPSSGFCPKSHPHRLPLLQLNQQWSLAGFDFDQLVLSNGDTTGLSMHGDFISGWKPHLLQDALVNCAFNPLETDRWHGEHCGESNDLGNLPAHVPPFREFIPIYNDTFPVEDVDGITEFPRGVGNCSRL